MGKGVSDGKRTLRSVPRLQVSQAVATEKQHAQWGQGVQNLPHAAALSIHFVRMGRSNSIWGEITVPF